MTNSESVDNYGFMPAKPFVMNNRTYCLIDGVQFVIYTIAPDLLPFSQTVVRDTRNEVTTRKFHAFPVYTHARESVLPVNNNTKCHCAQFRVQRLSRTSPRQHSLPRRLTDCLCRQSPSCHLVECYPGISCFPLQALNIYTLQCWSIVLHDGLDILSNNVIYGHIPIVATLNVFRHVFNIQEQIHMPEWMSSLLTAHQHNIG